MSQNIATEEPSRVFSGNTVKWKRSFGDYPSSAWTLYYRLIGQANQLITAAADGSGYLVTVTKADSFGWIPGNYRLVGYVTAQDDSERFTIYEGDLKVELDPATAADGIETRTFWRRVYDHLQAIIEGKAQQGESSYTVAGRSVSRMTWPEIMDAYNTAAAQVRQETAADRARLGKSAGNLIGVSFSRP